MYILSYFNKRNTHITQQLFSNNNIPWIFPQISTESLKIYLFCTVYTQIHIHTLIWFLHYIDHTHFNFCTHIFNLLSAQKSKIAKLWKQNKISKQTGHQFRKKKRYILYIYTHTVFNRYYANTFNTQCLLIDKEKKKSKQKLWMKNSKKTKPKWPKICEIKHNLTNI